MAEDLIEERDIFYTEVVYSPDMARTKEDLIKSEVELKQQLSEVKAKLQVQGETSEKSKLTPTLGVAILALILGSGYPKEWALGQFDSHVDAHLAPKLEKIDDKLQEHSVQLGEIQGTLKTILALRAEDLRKKIGEVVQSRPDEFAKDGPDLLNAAAGAGIEISNPVIEGAKKAISDVTEESRPRLMAAVINANTSSFFAKAGTFEQLSSLTKPCIENPPSIVRIKEFKPYKQTGKSIIFRGVVQDFHDCVLNLDGVYWEGVACVRCRIVYRGGFVAWGAFRALDSLFEVKLPNTEPPPEAKSFLLTLLNKPPGKIETGKLNAEPL
ncbi:MAG: hypothetical protein ABIR70_13915 [Bryobacteraceae bacterium]